MDTPAAPQSIGWLKDYDKALAESRNLKRPILIDVMKVPCRGCSKLDGVTFTDSQVISQIAERFVPLKLDLFADRKWVRPLNVFWTPTILFADRRGTIQYESLNYLPPPEFLDLLDIGEAMTRMRWAEYGRAFNLFGRVVERNANSAFAPEAIYRQGLVKFLQDSSNPALYDIWQPLFDRFPDSIWTKRIP